MSSDSSNIIAASFAHRRKKNALLAPQVGVYGNAFSQDPEAAASSFRSPQQIYFSFELTITVLVEQGEGLLEFSNLLFGKLVSHCVKLNVMR
jgi:hypothetical protein